MYWQCIHTISTKNEKLDEIWCSHNIQSQCYRFSMQKITTYEKNDPIMLQLGFSIFQYTFAYMYEGFYL